MKNWLETVQPQVKPTCQHEEVNTSHRIVKCPGMPETGSLFCKTHKYAHDFLEQMRVMDYPALRINEALYVGAGYAGALAYAERMPKARTREVKRAVQEMLVKQVSNKK